MINNARPDVLWVALGLPKQEWWIYRNRDRLRVPVAVAVGAAFGFVSGRVKRAPKWVGRAGFEWVWRLAMEPGKLWRRDLIDGPRFLVRALSECAGLFKSHDATIEQGGLHTRPSSDPRLRRDRIDRGDGAGAKDVLASEA